MTTTNSHVESSLPSSASSFDRVLEFHNVFGCTINGGIKNPAIVSLRLKLIREELRELSEALESGDIVAVAHELADLDYVVNGAAIAFGVVLPYATEEIHRANMTKLLPDGTALLRLDGKVLKGPNYEPPQLEPVLRRCQLVRLPAGRDERTVWAVATNIDDGADPTTDSSVPSSLGHLSGSDEDSGDSDDDGRYPYREDIQ